MTPPTIILVAGPAGTGKTTLIRTLLPRLAAAGIRLPVFTKDGFKETLFDTLGTGDLAWSKRLSHASMALLTQALATELAAGRSCLVEANFRADLATAELAALRAQYPFALVQILCRTAPAVLVERLRRRADSGERHPGHLDADWAPALTPETVPWRTEPLGLEGAVVEVDTTVWEAVDIDGIAVKIIENLKSKIINNPFAVTRPRTEAAR